MADTMKRSDLDFSEYKARLMELKTSSEQTLASMAAQDEDGLNTAGSDRSELSSADNHPADVATEVQIRAQDAGLMDNERYILAQVERALEKIEEGTYGLSDLSGAPISKERLDAMPHATMTIEEAEAGDFQNQQVIGRPNA
jgi:RNA polymerase-binding transcription factor DksA